MADNKNTRYQFTAYEGQYSIVDAVAQDKSFIKILEYQEEICPHTGRKHRQGCLQTQQPVRMSKVRSMIPGVHIEVALNWNALLAYCKKSASRDPSGNSVAIDNTSFSPKKVANFLDDIADYIWEEYETDQLCPASDREYEEPTHPTRCAQESVKAEYWRAVSYIVMTNPEAIGILAQPLPQNAWKNTRLVWLARSRDRRWSNSITLQQTGGKNDAPSINGSEANEA